MTVITIDSHGTVRIDTDGGLDSGRANRKLDQILALLGAVKAEEHEIMTDVASVKQLVQDIDVETNDVAAKVDAQAAAIADLKAQIAAGSPVTQADLDAIAAGLAPISDRLKAIGANPAAPIPPAV